ncbi:hypothetical protein Aduo_005236 [Ancylostoma duodenale]
MVWRTGDASAPPSMRQRLISPAGRGANSIRGRRPRAWKSEQQMDASQRSARCPYYDAYAFNPNTRLQPVWQSMQSGIHKVEFAASKTFSWKPRHNSTVAIRARAKTHETCRSRATQDCCPCGA